MNDPQPSPPRAPRWILWLPIVLFAGFFLLVVRGLVAPAGSVVESKFVGKAMPQFNLPAAAGDRPGLATKGLIGGKPRLLNVFASWCIPCAVEAPQLAALARAGVEINGVAVRDRRDELAVFLARYGNPYRRIGADDRSEVQLAIGSSGVPETFVIDAQGVIRYQHVGDIRAEDVPMLLDKLKEAEQ